MVSLILSFVVLIIGYIIYSRVTAKVFGADGRETPAMTMADGVDYTPMKTWKAFLIQLLNIAGTGPIFGALMGAVFGPIVFVWIVLGSILGGAVHDYMTGMISMRHKGASIADYSGDYLGKFARIIIIIFSLILLILVGSVFITSPAVLLAKLTPDSMNKYVWVGIIVAYYLLATILPIDKIIGKLYPVFGVILIIMAVSILIGIFAKGKDIPEFWSGVTHPNGKPAWPFVCITVACGAISGFHATQSPMVAKCLTSEKKGRQVFYGAMISETVIALVWAAAGVAFYGSTQILNEHLVAEGASTVVYDMSKELLGNVGGVLAIIGVVACPITTGDTAFRSARIILSELTHFEQKKLINRLILTIPLLAIGTGLTFINFDVIWRYFSWSNQTLAMISLWVVTIYLMRNSKYKYGSLISAIPAAFMVAVSFTYILMSDEFYIKANSVIGYSIGGSIAVIMFAIYLVALIKNIKKRTSI